MRAIQQQEFGGPEVLELVELPPPDPGDGEVLIRVSRAGMNFADTHQRTNSYLAKATLPLIPGSEVAGVREDTGERVVALCGTGGYAEYATAPAALAFPIPDDVDDGTALALLIQGLTAWHLYRTCGRVGPGESVVVVSGAGGVGSLAVQLGKPMGAGRVIATASTQAKRDLALELGATHAIDPDEQDVRDLARELTDGRGADYAFDSAGAPALVRTGFETIRRGGTLVCIGLAPEGTDTGLPAADLVRHEKVVTGTQYGSCRPHIDMPLVLDLFMEGRLPLDRLVSKRYRLDGINDAFGDMMAGRVARGVIQLA